jgi:predicted hydrocarbon binding protein
MSQGNSMSPKETIGYQYSPGKKVFLVSIEFKNAPGSLPGITSTLSKAGVKTLSGFTAIRGGGEEATWGFFAEAEMDLRAQNLKRLLDETSGVTKTKVIEGTGGLVVDTIHFPLKLNTGETMVLMRKEVFSDMFRRLGEMFGTGGESIVFEEGEATGENDGRKLVEIFGADGAMANTPELSMLYLTLGWGRPELVRFNPAPFSATIRLFDSFECSGQKSTKPNSQFIRGHMTGLINVLFGKRVKTVETKCRALGDECCEFVLSEGP